MNTPRELAPVLLEELENLLGERFTTSRGIREHHGKDESYYPYALPDAVVFPQSTEEVRDIVNICRLHATPMIPFGVGTSLEGHVLAIHGGVCVDLSQMNRIVAVREADLDCTVQAGVTRKQLNDHIRHSGLMFPIDPGADATLGGMAATRASGTNRSEERRVGKECTG
jgi:D-lactate dehydrogenase (cytochrome)